MKVKIKKKKKKTLDLLKTDDCMCVTTDYVDCVEFLCIL